MMMECMGHSTCQSYDDDGVYGTQYMSVMMMMVMECMGYSTCQSYDDDGDGVYGT